MNDITETDTKRNESVETWSRFDNESQLNELKQQVEEQAQVIAKLEQRRQVLKEKSKQKKRGNKSGEGACNGCVLF